MDTGKGVRKYGRLKHGLRWGRYFACQIAFVPLMALTGILVPVAILVCLIGGAISLAAAGYLMFSLLTGGREVLLYCLMVCVMTGGAALAAGWFLKCLLSGSFAIALFDPIAPEENPVLPDAELLVRPSSASAAHPAELLRSAKETAEEKPEELLRAGTE